ncbi:MAG: DUF2059 domain-containing protein [Thermodesulfobacteriota bacterium]|nr:DUF2059 domain-containing protein [Thermodesulfobacteriota bacterium]
MDKHTAPVSIFLMFLLICWTGCTATPSSKTKNSAGTGGFSAANTSTSQKKENIRKLIKISGNADIILQRSAIRYDNLMTQIFQRLRLNLPKQVEKKLRQEWRTEIERKIQDPGGLMDYIISIYDSHFTPQEIKDWLLFYESPLGKKINSTLPSVDEESNMAYQQWNRSINPVLYEWLKERLKKEGITIP